MYVEYCIRKLGSRLRVSSIVVGHPGREFKFQLIRGFLPHQFETCTANSSFKVGWCRLPMTINAPGGNFQESLIDYDNKLGSKKVSTPAYHLKQLQLSNSKLEVIIKWKTPIYPAQRHLFKTVTELYLLLFL